MKTTEFLKENSIIAQEADTMHKDHEVQMARSQMYNSANAAIEIHKLLKNISEMEGIEGWVASKLTLANQYLESVRDYLKYEQVDQQSEMMEFVSEAAEYAFDTLLAEDNYDDAVAAFLSKNNPVQGKTHKPRQSERLGGSRHIGGGKEKMKASRTGIGSKPTGKAVAGQASLGEEGYKDWSEKNPGKLNKQTADMYDRNTHRWSGDTGVPGAKEHGGKGDLKTVDREGNTVTNRATRIEKPEGVPKVSKKPITSFGGGGVGRTGGTMDPSAVKSLVPAFESKADPVGSWVVYNGSKVKRFKSRDGAKAYAEKNGGKVASSEHYADNIQSKQAVKENASGGASSAGSIAVSMGGPGHKPTSGVPKKIGNAHKTKKVSVGKGIY